MGEEKPDWREERGWKVGAMWLRDGGRRKDRKREKNKEGKVAVHDGRREGGRRK